ncbi:Kinesin-like protein bimC [Aspergillus nidulans FGSC A4] [Rhizoctonia solani]|uniref:Kinesin-like protein bimC [Aspergillus nidulans FGSC A4] n=1 Tax=Rhizoctonia solani TaxID=456999 RepID=A0A0K6GG77_9AGAM|nr:Kinesin-like protein bimC [Aspergillus nidulans FGSC A4] [Rhizoctonia solani]
MSRRAPSVARKASSSTRISSLQAKSKNAPSVPPTSLPPPSVARTQAPVPAQEDDTTTNIQVVIRCRGRNTREQADNSPIIVEIDGPRSEEITIETALPQSTFGVYTPAPTRTYPFDRVFGPEADQAMVYHDIVAPVLEEVLNGYNCTVFAYGQTGTGKTYTMQGDLSPTLTGNPSADAGIIPRTLHKLFLHLENSTSDYSVKVSFVELYNEELRDLLASEFKEPSANAQPMGIASGSGSSGLKIFDDVAKKGTFIQGLEEAHVRDAQDAIEILRKGSERRQIAATKFNDHSSRSHSIFTLTVHTKETSSDGNDLIKTGKLNLVDLAGSENIGRSGAENKRAREAGMINQSLLTLNRVITALVEKSPHVPYRESKLTRLLQDSLGGRTKTCIIATVSPARCNMEETLSTLDYAFQAKAIRNRPELNSRITRNALLKEHAGEIARLKADLVAAREKNGVYVSLERWREIESAQEGGKTVREELRVQAEVAQRQSRALQEELEAQGAVLVKKTNELAGIKQELEQEQLHLASARQEVRKLRSEVEEERVVRQEFERNEISLDRVATSLKETARTGVIDVKGLFGKIARHDALLSSNANVLSGFSERLHTEVAEFGARFEDFVNSHNSISHRIKSQAESFQTAELKASNRHSQLIDEHLRLLDATVASIQTTERDSEATLSALQAAVARTNEGIRASLEQWNTFVSRECSSLFSELAVQQEKHVGDADKALQAACGLLETVVTESQSYIHDNVKLGVSRMHQLVKQTSGDEILRLRRQNELLTTLLEAERIRSETMRDEVTTQIAALITGFTTKSHNGLREAIATAREGLREGEAALDTFVVQHEVETERAVTTAEGLINVLQSKEAEGRQIKEDGLKAIKQAKASFDDGNVRVRSSISTAMAGQRTEIGRQLSGLGDQASNASEQFISSKEKRLDTIYSFVRDSKKGCEAIQDQISTSSQSLQQTVGTVISHSTLLRNACQTYKSSVDSHVSTLDQAGHDLLSDVKTQVVPTGHTPRKRKWDYIDSWTLTGDREDILRTWRTQDPTPSLTASVAATEDLKSEPSTVSDRDSVALAGQPSPDLEPEQNKQLTKPEPQMEVDMGDAPASRIVRPSGLIPPMGVSRRSTMAPGLSGNKLAGFADENVVTRPKRLKR